MIDQLPPLEDPDYQPVHVPVHGRPPELVAKWGPRSQLRWFRRFYPELYAYVRGMKFPGLASDIANDYYCHSLEHKGPCCGSCISEEEDLGLRPYDDHCCCHGYNAARAT
jgi:hypothetical protein